MTPTIRGRRSQGCSPVTWSVQTVCIAARALKRLLDRRPFRADPEPRHIVHIEYAADNRIDTGKTTVEAQRGAVLHRQQRVIRCAPYRLFCSFGAGDSVASAIHSAIAANARFRPVFPVAEALI